MKDILVIFTGGTIGSTVKGDSIGIAPGSSQTIIRMYENEHGDADRFEFASPFTILSENLTPDRLNELLLFLNKTDLKKYKGVIITHGTDTLSFTAAFLGTLLKDIIPCPLVVVGTDKPPEVPGSNAFANFDGSVKLIDFLSKTGMYNDVFTVWQKEGTYAAYKGRELMAADSGCDSPAVYGGQPFAEFYPEGLNMTGEGFSWRIVINTLHEDRCLPVLEEEKRREIFAAGIKPGLKVAALRPYPGFSYEDVSVENADAVLVYGYHSGTFCTGEGAGEVKDRSLCIQTLTEKSKSAGRPLYIAPFKEDKKIYESAKALEGENVIKLYDMSFEAAYVNCLLLETSR